VWDSFQSCGNLPSCLHLHLPSHPPPSLVHFPWPTPTVPVPRGGPSPSSPPRRLSKRSMHSWPRVLRPPCVILESSKGFSGS